MLMIRVGNQDAPRTVEVSLVLAIESRDIRAVVHRHGVEARNVTVNVDGAWSHELQSVLTIDKGKGGLRDRVFREQTPGEHVVTVEAW